MHSSVNQLRFDFSMHVVQVFLSEFSKSTHLSNVKYLFLIVEALSWGKNHFLNLEHHVHFLEYTTHL